MNNLNNGTNRLNFIAIMLLLLLILLNVSNIEVLKILKTKQCSEAEYFENDHCHACPKNCNNRNLLHSEQFKCMELERKGKCISYITKMSAQPPEDKSPDNDNSKPSHEDVPEIPKSTGRRNVGVPKDAASTTAILRVLLACSVAAIAFPTLVAIGVCFLKKHILASKTSENQENVEMANNSQSRPMLGEGHPSADESSSDYYSEVHESQQVSSSTSTLTVSVNKRRNEEEEYETLSDSESVQTRCTGRKELNSTSTVVDDEVSREIIRNMCDVKRIAKTDFNRQFVVIDVARDGHCFLYALQKSLRRQGVKEDMVMINIMKAMEEEALRNRHLYQGFLIAEERADYEKHIKDYFESKKYNSDFCDLLSTVAANALSIKLILVVEQEDVSSLSCECLLFNEESQSEDTVLIYKSGEHFQAVAFLCG